MTIFDLYLLQTYWILLHYIHELFVYLTLDGASLPLSIFLLYFPFYASLTLALPYHNTLVTHST